MYVRSRIDACKINIRAEPTRPLYSYITIIVLPLERNDFRIARVMETKVKMSPIIVDPGVAELEVRES